MQVQACVFDAYGTLLDLAGAIAPHARELGGQGPPLLALWRQKQLEYTWLRTILGHHADFDTVTREALAYALEALGLSGRGLETALPAAFRSLRPYPEVRATLEALRARGVQTAILSNGTPATLELVVQGSGLAPLLDAVLSVEAVERFKPAAEVYRHAIRSLQLPPERIMFVSMHGWDVAGAGKAGFRCVLVNRTGAPAERLPFGPERVVTSLADVPGLVGA